jgi:hypothetical protein
MIRQTAVTVCAAFALLAVTPAAAWAAPAAEPCQGVVVSSSIQSIVALIHVGPGTPNPYQCTGEIRLLGSPSNS